MIQNKQIEFIIKNNLPSTQRTSGQTIFWMLTVSLLSSRRSLPMCFSHVNVCRVRLLNECNPPCWADILALLQHIWMVRQIVLEQCSLVIPVVKIRLSNVFLPAVPMSVPPIFERCNCLANIGCWAVCADCSIDTKVSSVQIKCWCCMFY